MHYISSRSNPQIKKLQSLSKRKDRDALQLFSVEGRREILLALKAGYKLDAVYCLEEVELPKEISPETNIYALSKDLMERISYRGMSEGILAVFHYQVRRDIEIKEKSLYLLVENIEKPGNLGAILRSADGAGVDAIFIVGSDFDLYNPNLIRSSLGAIFSQQLVIKNLKALASELKAKSIPLIATSPYAEKIYWQENLSSGVAWLVRSEKDGISEEAKSLADKLVSIPMLGKIDSLNVSVASALLIYETRRQLALKMP